MLKNHAVDSGEIYLGRGAGKEIKSCLENAKKSIKIVSPYISSDFIPLLKSKAQQGLDIHLIVSSDIGGQNDKWVSLRQLINQTRHTNEKKKLLRKRGMLVSTLLALIFIGLLGYFSYIENHQYLWHFISAILFSFFSMYTFKNMVIYTYTYDSDISLAIPMSPYTHGFDPTHTLIHAKLFIVDGYVAFIGSVNFTKSAFFKNYECRFKITDQQVVNSLDTEFTYLFNDREAYYLDITKTGKRIYKEPPN